MVPFVDETQPNQSGYSSENDRPPSYYEVCSQDQVASTSSKNFSKPICKPPSFSSLNFSNAMRNFTGSHKSTAAGTNSKSQNQHRPTPSTS